MRKLSEIHFEDLEGKRFELVNVIEMLCEVCQKPISRKERFLRSIQISTEEEYANLLNRAAVHDRAEVDVERARIYFYDHDYPGDVHVECIEKL